MTTVARNEAIGELAAEIARDNPGASPDACSAWAVQHVNETVMHRNAFSGLKGMTAAHAQAGLADYRTDRKRWSMRAYLAELKAGKIRCIAMKNHPYPDMPDGTLIHRNSEWLVTSWKEAGRVQEEYLPADCPDPECREKTARQLVS